MKNKFALCFRPVVIEAREEICGDSSSAAAVSRDISVAKVKENNRTVLPTSVSSSLLKNSGGSGVQVRPFPQPQNHSRKTLSRVLKTILFEAPPRMWIPGGKNRELTLVQEKTNDMEERKTHLEKVEDHKRKREVNIVSEENKTIPSIPSPSSSSIGTSSLSSSSYDQSSKDFNSSSMKRSLPRSRSNTSLDKNKKAKITKTNQYMALDSSSSICEDKDTVFYWMVLALFATVLCGKIFATLVATLCLYFIIPYYRSIIKPENNTVRLPEMETSKNASWEYKKKAIMEGMLERKAVLPHTMH